MTNFTKKLNDLEIYLGDECCNVEAIQNAIQKVRELNERAKSASYSKEELRQLAFEEIDPLDVSGADDFSDSFKESVREAQHGIINYYAL